MKKQRGQSLTEIAVTIPVLLIVMMGLLDVGRLYFTNIALEDASQEASLYYAINPACPYDEIVDGKAVADDEVVDTDFCDAPNNALYRAENAGGKMIRWPNATFESTIIYIPEMDWYRTEVTLTYKFRFVTPLMLAIVENEPITLSATSSDQLFVLNDLPEEYRHDE